MSDDGVIDGYKTTERDREWLGRGIRLGLEAAADVWVDLSRGRPDAVDAVIAMRTAIRAINPSDVLKNRS